MAKAITAEIISEKLYLLDWDEDGDTWVQFQRPSRWEDEQIASLRSRAELVWDSEEQGTVRQRDSVPLTTQESEMVALCITASNLVFEDESPVFVAGKNCREVGERITAVQKRAFYQTWYGLPGPVADNIVQCLRDWHPPFDYRNPQRGEE